LEENRAGAELQRSRGRDSDGFRCVPHKKTKRTCTPTKREVQRSKTKGKFLTLTDGKEKKRFLKQARRGWGKKIWAERRAQRKVRQEGKTKMFKRQIKQKRSGKGPRKKNSKKPGLTKLRERRDIKPNFGRTYPKTVLSQENNRKGCRPN